MLTIDMDLSTSTDRRRFAWARTVFLGWLGRARERRALAAMDDRTLRDLGLTRYEIATEIARSPRWRR